MTGDLTETLTTVLGEHEFQSGSGWGRPSCSCDEWTTDERHYEQIHAAHRAHVAAVLAALVAAEREKAVEDLRWHGTEGHRFVGMNCECGHELNSPQGWFEHVVISYAAQMHAAASEGGDR